MILYFKIFKVNLHSVIIFVPLYENFYSTVKYSIHIYYYYYYYDAVYTMKLQNLTDKLAC